MKGKKQRLGRGEDTKLLALRTEAWARSQGRQMAQDTGKGDVFLWTPVAVASAPVLAQ